MARILFYKNFEKEARAGLCVAGSKMKYLIEKNSNPKDLVISFYKKYWSLIPLTIFLISSLAKAGNTQSYNKSKLNENPSSELRMERHIEQRQSRIYTISKQGTMAPRKMHNEIDKPSSLDKTKPESKKLKDSKKDSSENKETKNSAKDIKAVPMNDQFQLIGFQTWGKIQKINAQNELARLKNEKLIRSSKLSKKSLANLNIQIEMAEQKVELSKSLSFDNYLAVFLAQIGDNKELLLEFASKLSKEQIAEVLKRLQKQKRLSGLMSHYQ